MKGIKVKPLVSEDVEIWNAAVEACCEAVYSDGFELHPGLVALLRTLKKWLIFILLLLYPIRLPS